VLGLLSAPTSLIQEQERGSDAVGRREAAATGEEGGTADPPLLQVSFTGLLTWIRRGRFLVSLSSTSSWRMRAARLSVSPSPSQPPPFSPLFRSPHLQRAVCSGVASYSSSTTRPSLSPLLTVGPTHPATSLYPPPRSHSNQLLG
jgi:hypothetical protein